MCQWWKPCKSRWKFHRLGLGRKKALGRAVGNLGELFSNEKRVPGWLGYIGDEILSRYIVYRDYNKPWNKDPYQPTSILWWKGIRDFFVPHLWRLLDWWIVFWCPLYTFCLVGKHNWKKLYTWILGLSSSQVIFFVGKWVTFTLCLGRKKRR